MKRFFRLSSGRIQTVSIKQIDQHIVHVCDISERFVPAAILPGRVDWPSEEDEQ